MGGLLCVGVYSARLLQVEGTSSRMRAREIIFEFRRIGSVVKVTAIDVASGTEAVIAAPAHAAEYALRDAARRKLAYVMKRQGLALDEGPTESGA